MATSKKPAKAKTAIQTVDDFMGTLVHPLKSEMAAVLQLIRGANPEISDGIKWNAPSFFYREWFATVNIRSNDAVQIILHLGAKARVDITGRIVIDDPGNLLQWLGKDRASVKFANMQAVRENGELFQTIISQWIKHLR